MSIQTMPQFSTRSHPEIFCGRTKRPYNLIFLLNDLHKKGQAPTSGIVDCSPEPWLFKYTPNTNPHASCLLLIGLGGTATVTTHTATFVDSRPRARIKETVYRPQLEQDESVVWTPSSTVKRIDTFDRNQALYVSDYVRYLCESTEASCIIQSIRDAICVLLPATAGPTRVTHQANQAFAAMMSTCSNPTAYKTAQSVLLMGELVAQYLDTISREILGAESLKGVNRTVTLSIVDSLENKETNPLDRVRFEKFQYGLQRGFARQ